MTGKLPRITAADTIRALERAGFSFSRQSGSHKIYKNDKGKLKYRKFSLGSSGEMHFDFADKPGMVHEYVSNPFSLENGESKFKKFVNDIFIDDKDKAIQYFNTKERLEDLTLDQLQTLCSHEKMETEIKNRDGSMKTKNKIISDILKLEWEELDEKTLKERIK